MALPSSQRRGRASSKTPQSGGGESSGKATGRGATGKAVSKRAAQRKSTPEESTKKAATKKAATKKAAGTGSPKKSESKASPAGRPSPLKGTSGAGLGKRFMAEVKSRLDDEKERLLAQLEELQKERKILTEDREDRDDAFTEESGEGAGTLAEQEREESLTVRIRELLDKVERAMRKIPKGSYGLCEGCENPIERARLEALPYAALCIECKRKEERRF